MYRTLPVSEYAVKPYNGFTTPTTLAEYGMYKKGCGFTFLLFPFLFFSLPH